MTPEMIAILAVGVALAGLMLRGHHGIGIRFDGVDKRFDGVDKRIDGVDNRIDSLEQRFDNRIDSLEQRFDNRIDGLEQRFDNRIDRLEQHVDKRMDGFDERLRSLETGQAELKGTILGKLDLIERYIIARNLLSDDPAPQTGGADE